MRNAWRFAFLYSYRNWSRNKLFVLLCILGVSAATAIAMAVQLIVIHNELYVQENIKVLNGGDINVTLHHNISHGQMEQLQRFSLEYGFEYTLAAFRQGRISADNSATIVVMRFVQVHNYPLYGNVSSPDTGLLEGNLIILSRNVAERLNFAVGDEAVIFNEFSGTVEEFTVSAIIPDSNIANMENDMHIFGYVYLNSELLDRFTDDGFGKIYIKMDNSADIERTASNIREIFPES